MKRRMSIVVCLLAVLFLVNTTHAALSNRGTDNLGNRLIYDSDLNITWYDYTTSGTATWQNQMNWAGTLDVEFGGTHYTDWRLPSTVDGLWVDGYDSTTTGGYNISSSEMGHLWYTELGNLGYYNTSGSPTGCSLDSPPYCLTNTGAFQHLQPTNYWSGTEYAADTGVAWNFDTYNGYQGSTSKGAIYYAIAVRPGDVTVVPEPISSILFVTGGALIAGRKYMRRGK